MAKLDLVGRLRAWIYGGEERASSIDLLVEGPLRADPCVGRDQFCDAIVRSSIESRSVLLFGARQSGKTTVLFRVASRLRQERGNTRQLGSLVVPVYVDLLRLTHDAGTGQFFGLLAQSASTACTRQVDGFKLPNASRSDAVDLPT